MTKKLKKKFNRIAIFALAVLASVIVVLGINTNVFVMPMSLEDIEKTGVSEIVETETAENENIDNAALETEVIQDTAPVMKAAAITNGSTIECESIVQGARDNDIPDRNLYFQNFRKR